MRRARATCSHNASWSRSVRACTSGRDFGSPSARIGSPNDTPTFGRNGSLHPQARLPPASLRSPQADRDHGASREQRDPRRALLHGEQLVAGPDGAFRRDARQPAVLHHVGHLLERAPHARTAADRHLSQSAQGPSHQRPFEVLAQREAADDPAAPCHGEPDEDGVQDADVVVGDQGAPTARDVLGAGDADAERRRGHRADGRASDVPPRVALGVRLYGRSSNPSRAVRGYQRAAAPARSRPALVIGEAAGSRGTPNRLRTRWR